MAKININSILKRQISLVEPDKESIKYLEKVTEKFIDVLNFELSKSGTDAKAFVGGSFARGTLVKQDSYDIDIFVRFDWKYEKLSVLLEKVLEKVCNKLKFKLERVHGSRDYYKVYGNGGQKWYFEVIPVTKIMKPSEERNITDLSYFHVPYVKKKIKGLENQVRLAKVFFKAKKVYGAETYVRGFSGYTIELLIIKYGSFIKMLKELIKVKKDERLVIDTEKYYKRKNDVFIEMNESKLNSPIILVDPTYKERNALAALSSETFYRFQDAASKFLKDPKQVDFIEKEIDVSYLKKKAKSKKSEFLHLVLKTNRQEGDIAGTKLKKFADMFVLEIGKYFKIIDFEFDYSEKQIADIFLIVKSKNEVVRIGPPVHLKKFVRAFEKEHMNTYVKNKLVHAKIKINFSARSYIDIWKKENKGKIRDMGIIDIKFKNL